jgi:flagellar hook-associated protein FlgK
MLHTLNVAQTGLKVSQTQVENVMNNIANQNVDGYKKRVVDVSEIEHADSRITGRGVMSNDVSRITNVYMYQNLINEEAKFNDIKELNTLLGDIESIFSETDESGVSAELNRYFKSIENLRTSPHNEIYKNDIKNSANSLINGLQTLYEDIEKKEDMLLDETKDLVDKVNGLLTEIGKISKKIVDSTGATPNDLLDKRDKLEKELAQFVDVEITREDSYHLKIAGVTAVRFDTNVHNVKLIEQYSPQNDIYAAKNTDGTTKIATIGYDNTGDGKIDSLTDLGAGIAIKDYDTSFTFSSALAPQAEIQTIDINGIVDDNSGDPAGTAKNINFLGYPVPTQMGDDGTALAADIVAASTAPSPNLIDNWNTNNPDREIASITATGNQLSITYATTEGDVPAISNNEENGISFTGSIEDYITPAANAGKGYVESLTYVLDNTESINVTIGDTIVDTTGAPVDFDGSGAPIGEITKDNIIQAMVYQINEHKDIGSKITAYNGKYETSDTGEKILTSDPRHSKYIDPTIGVNTPGFDDRYLFIESNIDGEKGSFVGELLVNKPIANPDFPSVPTSPQYINEKEYINRNETVSSDAIDDIHLEIYDKEVSVTAGELRPMLDNLKTDSGNNLLKNYKERLDQFAEKLSDFTDSYIEQADGKYLFGTDAVSTDYDADKAVNINLFDGASVKTLKFNDENIRGLTQEKLDYLAELQWKEDINFDGTGENNQSFSKYFQTLRVSIADDRENVIFNQEAQEAVKESLQNSYDQLTKVDKDEEMVNLIKFQSAYEANAKIITTVDQMLETLLGLKR